MLIDLILDRKEGLKYRPENFKRDVLYYVDVFPCYKPVAKAILGGKETDVKRELCRYIDREGYNPEIKSYVQDVRWLAS